MPKHRSREREKKEQASGICGRSTKGTAREEAGVSHLEKDTGILQ